MEQIAAMLGNVAVIVFAVYGFYRAVVRFNRIRRMKTRRRTTHRPVARAQNGE